MKATEFTQGVSEEWSKKYKDSINCSNPKGFSQRAHCAGRKKNEDVEEAQQCPECGGPMFSDLLINEKQDACYYKVKSRYKVWPSAYASGALVQCRKKGAKNWGNKSEGVAENLNEFAPNDSGDDGFSDETLKKLAAQWHNGDEDPRVERILAAAGWEIGQDEGYDDEPGVFVVQAGDINGNSYMSWPAHELQLDENLRDWFKEKWVRFGPDGKIRGDCARGDDSEGKPKCLPQSKAHSLGKQGRASAAARKRREDPNAERSGPAINVNTKKKSNEDQLDELKCWPGHHRVAGTEEGEPGSCAKNKTNEQGEKIGGMDAGDFDAAMARLKKLAGAGPMKTVWDPVKRVYKNVPVSQQPKKAQ